MTEPPPNEPTPPYVHPVPGMSPFDAVAPPGVEAPAAAQRTHPLAVVSVLAAIAFCVPGSTLAAVVCGTLAWREIRRDPERHGGAGLALTGLVLGSVEILAYLVAYVAFGLGVATSRHGGWFGP